MSRLENIQNSFKSIQAKTKAFFHGDRWKEVLVFFFFALLAFGFWLLQSLQQEYEIELVFPVKYKNVPVDIAFNVPEVETITAKVVIVAIFYFFMIRPQQKKQKEIQKSREALKTGDKVITAGGIYGKIKEIGDTYMLIEVADGVRIRVDKTSIFASAEDAQQQK